MSATVPLPAEKDTLALGAALAHASRRGDVIALSGPLGAGKTTLARGFIHQLTGNDEDVVSPTFTLVQGYETRSVPVWHFDLYRIKTPDDVFELGLEEALAHGISLIEWPEQLGSLLPAARLDVMLNAQGAGRIATLSGDAWADRLPVILNHVRS